MEKTKVICRTDAQLFLSRAKIIDREIGTLALSLATFSASTDAPRVFAFISMLIVLVWMRHRVKAYDRIYRLWREIDHPLTKAENVWRHFPLFNIGWLALGLEAIGLIGKTGILGF